MTTDQYLAWFDEVLSPTEPMFLLVPSDRLEWKPTPTSFAIGQLLNHIPRSLWFMTKVINGEELPLKSMREIFVANRRQGSSGPEEAIQLLGTYVPEFKAAIKKLGDERFQNGSTDTPQKGRVPYWRYAAFALEHHIHHLMELHMCLRLLGVKVNTGTLYTAGR